MSDGETGRVDLFLNATNNSSTTRRAGTNSRVSVVVSVRRASIATLASAKPRALVSVSDKSGMTELASGLAGLGYEIVSTGGSAKAIEESGTAVTSVDGVTGFPEMLDGRVKTLHPGVHGGILAKRDNASHMEAIAKHGIDTIDIVAVNLYPFRETVAGGGDFAGEMSLSALFVCEKVHNTKTAIRFALCNPLQCLGFRVRHQVGS